MKKKVLNLFLLLTLLGFVGCSSDKDDVPSVDFDQIAGVYKGTLAVEVESIGIDTKGIPAKVYVEKSGEGKVTVKLKDFSFEGIELGDIIVKDMSVKKDGPKHELSGQDRLSLIVGECDVKVDGDIEGKKLDLDIDINVVSGAISMKVEVDFEGVRLDQDQSSEAEILSFSFENPLITGVEIDQKAKKILLTVASEATEEELNELTPQVVISDKATITPSLDKAQNFNKPVVYKVTSEDGTVSNEYTVLVDKKVYKFDFEVWEKEPRYTSDKKGVKYESYLPLTQGKLTWDSSDGGAQNIFSFYPEKIEKYGVSFKDGEFNNSRSAVIETIFTTGNPSIFGLPAVPKVTAGSLFLGEFSLVLKSPLESTKFGIPFTEKPLLIKGALKYLPGKDFYGNKELTDKNSNKAELNPTAKDEYAISAVLYEVADEEETLTGVDIYTSDKIVAVGQKFGGETKEYEAFSFELEYKKEYDPAKKYKLALIFSSSRWGDKFSGAPGSTLYIDDVEIVIEN